MSSASQCRVSIRTGGSSSGLSISPMATRWAVVCTNPVSGSSGSAIEQMRSALLRENYSDAAAAATLRNGRSK